MSIFGADGRAQITVDTLGFLANTLRGYEATSILREQLQNADDACHKQNRPGELSLEFLADRLVVTNPSVFNDEDWERVVTPSSRGKFTDSEQTGEFGIGFWGSLHLTDTPIITSGTQRVTLDPKGAGASSTEVPAIDGTRFEFPYRRSQTEIGERLDVGVVDAATERRMVDVFIDQMADLLLFTRAIETISLVTPDGEQRRAHREVRRLADTVDSLEMTVDGAPEQNCRYIVVRTEVDDPPPHRHGKIAVALPAESSRPEGCVFVTFPTETSTALNLSINAHFRATDDRRSLENAGAHGQWNARIFAAAGAAVGAALEVLLDSELTGVAYDTAISWFSYGPAQDGEIGRRARQFIEAVDNEARGRAVAPDTHGELRRCVDLANLEPHIERILGRYVGDTLQPGQSVATLAVLRRWGLRRWQSSDVAHWLAQNVPTVPTKRADSPPFLASLDDAMTLIEYCSPDAERLAASALIRADREDVYYPARGVLVRKASDIDDLVDGLELPIAHSRFASTSLGRIVPLAGAAWLGRALRHSEHLLLGKRVPLKSVGVARDQMNVQQALRVLRRGGESLEGLPLAMDEAGVLQRFTAQTVTGLPDGPGRKPVANLCRRLELLPLQPKLDDQSLDGEVERFSLSLVLERLPLCEPWDPISDSRLLVEAIAELNREREPSPILLARLRERRMWGAADGTARALTELRLPAKAFRGRSSSIPLLHTDLVGELEPTATVFATFNRVLQVEVLDGKEEFVMECESPPDDVDEQLLLLETLGDLDDFTESQQRRLKATAFVLCQDGELRRPIDVLVTAEALPLSLAARRVVEAGLDRRSAQRLLELGARQLPRPSDLVEVGREIAMIDPQDSRDPGLILWNFLEGHYSDYTEAELLPLSEVAWLSSNPGPQRRAPKDCLDPRFSFASMVFPVPVGVRTPSADMREKLRMKARLADQDFVRIGEYAAEHQIKLEAEFFRSANVSAVEGSVFEATIGRLRSLPVIPLTNGNRAPDRLAPRHEAEVWGHLRELVPDHFEQDFPNLARTWGMTEDREIDWRLHLDVLEEIGTLAAPDEEDLRLANARLESLAAEDFNEHELDTIRRRAVVVTSMGPRTIDESFRGDLPPATLDRIRPFIPIVDEWDRVSPLLDALDLRGARSVVRLEPVLDNPTPEDRWQSVFQMHQRNLLRFLKGSVGRLDGEVMNSWPPSVIGVTHLSIRALIDFQLVDQWESEAHLATVDGSLLLYVRSDDVSHRAVVDAISVQFGIDQARKSLLLSVLRSGTAAEGEAELDWVNIAKLGPDEMTPVHVHVATRVDFADEGATPEPVALDRPALLRESGHAPPEEPPVDGDEPDEVPQSGVEEPSVTAPQEGGTELVARTEEEKRVSSPRGVTDQAYLKSQGITTTFDLDDEVIEADYRPDEFDDDSDEADEVRVCLSYYDVLHGQLPVSETQLRRLTTGSVLRGVVMFGDELAARQHGPRSIRIDDGAMVFAKRQIVPGTIVRLVPSSPGMVEAVLRPDPHRVNGVWMLELDESGRLERLRLDDLELEWETDDAFYRAERRLEDVEALMMDGGKSAIQLIIEVFNGQPGVGLTVEEIWGLVAVNRLFAKATIATHLSQQTGMFERVDGLWYMVGTELRRKRGSAGAAASRLASTSRAGKNQIDELLRVARKLAKLAESADRETLHRARAILERSVLHATE